MFVYTFVIQTEKGKKEMEGKRERERKFVHFNFKRLMYKKIPKFILSGSGGLNPTIVR